MGSCMGTPVRSSLTPNATRQFTPGTSNNNSNEEQFSSERGGYSSRTEEAFPNGQILPTPNLKIFTFSELKSATKNFRSDTVLGEGGFGKVFKGYVDERTLAPSRSGIGTAIAVKRLNQESMQGLEEWQSEVNFLGRLSHPNLVKLLGYCMEDDQLLLVYEFMPKGSLESHLFRKGSAVEPLSWCMRLNIILGAAKGLEFLHTSEKQVIFRDIKASNILLDSNYRAKISDFGLAKYGPLGGNSHVTTRVMGTYGYAAPEYVATGHLYVKSDVYGFGVVLLEILSAQRAMDPNRPAGQRNLVEWAIPYLSDRRKVSKVMDPRIEGQYPAKGALQAARLILNCLEPDPRDRPSMKEVVEVLKQIRAINYKPKESKTRAASHAGRRDGRHHSPTRSSSHPNSRGTRANAGHRLSPRR